MLFFICAQLSFEKIFDIKWRFAAYFDGVFANRTLESAPEHFHFRFRNRKIIRSVFADSVRKTAFEHRKIGVYPDENRFSAALFYMSTERIPLGKLAKRHINAAGTLFCAKVCNFCKNALGCFGIEIVPVLIGDYIRQNVKIRPKFLVHGYPRDSEKFQFL